MNAPGGRRPRRPIAVVGATATGKSALAHAAALARQDIELISIDAMQVYRGLDIGTAKPTQAERTEVRYHGIDLVDPSEVFSVADCVAAYDRARHEIDGRGHWPLLVGGTGLYLRAITDGLDLAGSWPELRAELEAAPDVAALYDRLRVLDPVAAGRIEPTNQRRIVRALEVCLGSGRPFSSFGPGLTVYGEPRVDQIGLHWDRARLAVRIEHRVHQMMERGLLHEVATSSPRRAGCRARPARRSATRSSSLTSRDVSRSTTPCRRSSYVPASSRSARIVGSAGTPAYAGSRSTATPSSRRCPSS